MNGKMLMMKKACSYQVIQALKCFQLSLISYLDMLDYGLGDFDENDLLDDELFKSDELYNMNMNEYLKEFFQSGIKQNLADFHQFAQGLSGGQQEFLQSL